MKKPKLNNDVALERAFQFPDLKTEDEGFVIEGHAAVYDQKADIDGWFFEIIERGAFIGTDFDDVLFCINHDTRKIPIARSRRNNKNSTMQIRTDEQGLYIRAVADVENNAEAKSLYSSIKRGDIQGMSLIFYVEEERWEDLDTDTPTRYITKIKKVKEVTAASLPYYNGTDINARSKEALDNAKLALDNARAGELDNSMSDNEMELERLRTNILRKV